MGNGIAFLFRVAFNLLGNVDLLFLLDYPQHSMVLKNHPPWYQLVNFTVD
jgi:hypothetical protein